MNGFYLSTFILFQRFHIFIWLPILNLIIIIIIIIIIIVTVVLIIFFIVIAIIISSFLMLLTFVNLVFIILFYIFVYIEYFKILNRWRGRTLFNVCNKDYISVSEMNFEQCLFNLSYSFDGFILKWHYYVLLLTIFSFIRK